MPFKCHKMLLESQVLKVGSHKMLQDATRVRSDAAKIY